MSLMNVFLNTAWEAGINESNPLGSNGGVVREFGTLVQKVWRGQAGVVEPGDSRRRIGDFAAQFAGWGSKSWSHAC